ncbi:MAG: PAS domain-containing protein [Candidatus Moranbacteria bacterium]|nr:PAS domain-containing protein [Candidatus Moranbacteria bacterium]
MINQKLSGFTQKDAIGKHYSKIFRLTLEKNNPLKKDFIKEVLKTGKSQTITNDALLKNKNNQYIPIADSAAPLKNHKDEIMGCVVVFRDATKERELDRAKTEMISLASHQLRTPLASINWYIEMLLNEDAGKITREQRSYMNEIFSSTKRMTNLVSALLNVSRIELGTLAIDPENVSLSKIMDSAIKELAHQIKNKELKLVKKYKKTPKVIIDPNLIRIVFLNLVSNSVKYTPPKGKIEISIEPKKENVLITIKDNGYGIPEEQQDKIFKKMFRADNVMEKETDGTGLGLYIVKSIINQSNGRIWFESQKDKGTTFFIELPQKGCPKQKGSENIDFVQ